MVNGFQRKGRSWKNFLVVVLPRSSYPRCLPRRIAADRDRCLTTDPFVGFDVGFQIFKPSVQLLSTRDVPGMLAAIALFALWRSRFGSRSSLPTACDQTSLPRYAKVRHANHRANTLVNRKRHQIPHNVRITAANKKKKRHFLLCSCEWFSASFKAYQDRCLLMRSHERRLVMVPTHTANRPSNFFPQFVSRETLGRQLLCRFFFSSRRVFLSLALLHPSMRWIGSRVLSRLPACAPPRQPSRTAVEMNPSMLHRFRPRTLFLPCLAPRGHQNRNLFLVLWL